MSINEQIKIIKKEKIKIIKRLIEINKIQDSQIKYY